MSQVHSHYVGTQDVFGGCGLPCGSDREAVLIGVAAPGMLHALSFLLDQRKVVKVIGINTSAAHLEHVKSGIAAWRQASTPSAALLEWLGWRIPDVHPEEGCYLDNDKRVYLQPFANEITFSGCTLDVPTPRVAFSWLGRRQPLEPCVGWRYGWLDEVAIEVKPPADQEWVQGDINTKLVDLVDQQAGKDVVIYLSNLLCGGQVVKKLCDCIKMICRAANVHVWVDDNIVKNRAHAEHYFGKHVPFQLLREDRPSPHHVTNQVLASLRLPGSLLEIHPEGELAKRWDFLDYRTVGTEIYLNNPLPAETICLHINSCFKNGSYLTNRDRLRQIVEAARPFCKRLLILEHNPYTRDHLTQPMHNAGTPVGFWRELLGRKENQIHWCRGVTDMRRNYYAVYDKEPAK